MKFEKHNANPANKQTCDCVFRALTKGLNKPWLEVYDSLCSIGRTITEPPNAHNTYKEYLKRLGYADHTLPAVKGQPRKKVKDFAEGTYILFIANHLTVVQDGILYDSWDCKDRAVYRYWKL